MHRLAPVRRAGERQVLRREPPGVGRAGLDQGDRLDRLQRGAGIGHEAGIAPAVDHLARGIGDSGGAEMDALHDRSAPKLG